MEIIDNDRYGEIFKNKENWNIIRIEQPSVPDPRYLIKQFRLLFNSSLSLFGMNNRNFIKRYIDNGIRINYMSGDTGVMLILCQSKRNLDTTFQRHLLMRYQHCSNMKNAKISISPIKTSGEKTLLQSVNSFINEELNKIFEAGYVPQPKLSLFGSCYGNHQNKTL